MLPPHDRRPCLGCRRSESNLTREAFLDIPLCKDDAANKVLTRWALHAAYGPQFFEPIDLENALWDDFYSVMDDEDVRLILVRLGRSSWALWDEHQEVILKVVTHADVWKPALCWWRCASEGDILKAMREVHYYPSEFGASGARRVQDADLSPRRRYLHNFAYEAMQRQASGMRRAAKKRVDEIHVGTCVQIAAAAPDRNRIASPNVTLVCVECVEVGRPTGDPPKRETKYRLAGRRGVQPTLYSRSHVKALPRTTPLAMQLQGVLQEWRSMPFVSIRQNIGAQNPLGVQGVVRCDCLQGRCEKYKCSCLKAGRLCTSRCHHPSKGTHDCRNHDGPNGNGMAFVLNAIKQRKQAPTRRCILVSENEDSGED